MSNILGTPVVRGAACLKRENGIRVVSFLQWLPPPFAGWHRAVHRSCAEQIVTARRQTMPLHRGTTGGYSMNMNTGRITAEEMDVTLNPLEGGALILQSVVPRGTLGVRVLQRLQRHVAEQPLPKAGGYENHTVVPRDACSVIPAIIPCVAVHETPSPNVQLDGQRSFNSFWNYDVEMQAIFWNFALGFQISCFWPIHHTHCSNPGNACISRLRRQLEHISPALMTLRGTKPQLLHWRRSIWNSEVAFDAIVGASNRSHHSLNWTVISVHHLGFPVG
mmetsp:Transcript_39834/g.95598  ORF Transcript_39834/g.95598 Transcript_39834/m.95598 type:complete len:277 (-) Transcript_39834:522-1352(-)